MVHGLVASPLNTTQETNDRPELYRETTAAGGSLVYYGAAPNTKRSLEEDGMRKFEQRWWWSKKPKYCDDKEAPTCSTSNGARNEICDKLATALRDHSRVGVGESPRQICYKDQGKACCVSWGTKIPHLTKGDLAVPARKSKIFHTPTLLSRQYTRY